MSSTCYLETNTHTENILNGNGVSISNTHKGNLNKNCTKNASTLTMLKLKNPERIIIWQLNINSFRNIFKYITEIILENVNIYLASEAKLDSSFLYGQFCIQIYSKPYRLDRTEKCGGNNTIYKEQIKSKLLKLVRINRRESKNSQQVPLHHLNQGGTYRKELIFKFSIARNFLYSK